MNPERYLERKITPEQDQKAKWAKWSRQRSNKMSRAQEQRLAGTFGGRRDASSGAGRPLTRSGKISRERTDSRGDVDTKTLCIEAKATGQKSLSIKQEWIEKIADAAASTGRTPALAFTFENMPKGYPRDFVAVPKEWLAAVLRKAGLHAG